MGRSRDYQAVTTDANKLLIGVMQVRVGAPCPRTSGTAYMTAAYPLQTMGVSAVTLVASGTYTGDKDGAYIVEIETGGATYKYTAPDGTSETGQTMATSATDIGDGDGVLLDFSAATGATVGHKWVIGVKAAGAITATQTNITSVYSCLDKSFSLGSLQSAQITGDITTKEHTSGYPAVKDLVITEATNLSVEVNIEEFGNTVTAPLFAAMLDAINTGTVYAYPVECIAQFANGDIKSFWFPNTNLVPNLNINPGTDWAGTPLKFDAVAQTGDTAAMKLIYMNDFAAA
jgi:hypothetical protein